jgi:hypothetical protein
LTRNWSSNSCGSEIAKPNEIGRANQPEGLEKMAAANAMMAPVKLLQAKHRLESEAIVCFRLFILTMPYWRRRSDRGKRITKD